MSKRIDFQWKSHSGNMWDEDDVEEFMEQFDSEQNLTEFMQDGS